MKSETRNVLLKAYAQLQTIIDDLYESSEKALENNDVTEADEGIVTYMMGELHRRLGDNETAANWFARVIDRAKHDPSWQRLSELAQRQHETPRNTI